MDQKLFADLGIVNPRTTFSAETAVDMIKAATLIVQTHPGTLGGEPAASRRRSSASRRSSRPSTSRRSTQRKRAEIID